MTLTDCYSLFGGNFKEVSDRLQSDTLIQKYLIKFADLNEFDTLRDALKQEDYDKAALTAYSIMVSSLHLGFPLLQKSAGQLCAALDSHNIKDIEPLMGKAQAEYDTVCDAIRQYAVSL